MKKPTLDWTLRNQLIFPSLLVATFCSGWLFSAYGFCLFGIYLFIFLCCKRKIALLLLALFCGLIVLVLGISSLPKMISPGKTEMILQVEPDTIQLKENLVTFDGEDQQKRRFRCSYQLKKQTDHEMWQQRKNWQVRIRIKGEIQLGQPQRNQYGFDYQRYLKINGYSGILKIHRIEKKQAISKVFSIRGLRAGLIDHIEKSFSTKSSAYVSALLTGYKDQRFEELTEIFAPAGVLHLFSISGMHVYFFLGGIQKLVRRLRWTPQETFPLFCLITIVLIGLMGGAPGVWRAGLLFLLRLFTQMVPVRLSAMDCFALVLLVLLILDPAVVVKTSGLLSLMMSWLILCQPKASGWLRLLIRSQWLSLLAAPLILYLFFEWPLMGGILTFLLAPIFQFILLPTALLLLSWSFIGKIPAVFLAGFDQLLTLVETLSGLFPWLWRSGQPPFIIMLLGLFAGGFFYQRKKYCKAIIFCLLLPTLPNLLSVETAVTFVDVGQGDAILLTAPLRREVVLIDTGGKLQFFSQKGQKRNADYTLLPLLKGKGIRKIDKLLLTHGDTDHMGDVLALAKHIFIDTVYLTNGSQQHPNIKKMLAQLAPKTKIKYVKAGDRVGSFFRLEVLHPFKEGKGENEDSMVVATKVKGQRFLLTGDLGKEGEKQVLRHYPSLAVDVLKLGHHGSRTSTDADFLKKVAPKQAIISCGFDNRFGHPHEEVVTLLKEQNIEILRTDQQGMISYRWKIWQTQPTISKIKE